MEIIKTIQEAATWIEKVNPDYESNLYRTDTLNPNRHFYEMECTDSAHVLTELVTKRSQFLAELGIPLIPAHELSNYGRIMLFDATETFWDGAPENESACYVDIYDTPPHDTWIAIGAQLNDIEFYTPGRYLNENVLLAWVPKAQYFYANGAIEVACMDNFEWPVPNNIAEKYSVLKDVFTMPESILEPNEVINLEKRQAMLKLYVDELDRISPKVEQVQSLKKSNETIMDHTQEKKSFWDKLFGR